MTYKIKRMSPTRYLPRQNQNSPSPLRSFVSAKKPPTNKIFDSQPMGYRICLTPEGMMQFRRLEVEVLTTQSASLQPADSGDSVSLHPILYTLRLNRLGDRATPIEVSGSKDGSVARPGEIPTACFISTGECLGQTTTVGEMAINFQ